MNSAAPLAFSRMFSVSSLRDLGSQIAITATPAECAALAAEDGLAGVLGLEADFSVSRDGRTGLKVAGQLRATVIQTCVLSLEPFEAKIVTPVEARYDSRKREDDIDFVLDDPDPPEPVVNGKIDLGTLAAEFLALSLDPYPRKPDAQFDPQNAVAGPARISPFAGLKDKLAAKEPKN